MVKVGVPPVPVVVPVCIMPRNDVVTHTQAALIRLPCDCWTRPLGSRMIELGQHVRWMAKRRKARSCALKVPSATYATHATEADATSSGANTACDLSATMEPTPALEAAPTKVTAATTPTKPTTTVSGRPRYGSDRQGCDANYQSNC